VLTMVFDTLMIAADLYVFDPDRILGVYIWGAPVEDFAYAVAASMLMPALWTWLGRRSGRRRAADGTSSGTASSSGTAWSSGPADDSAADAR
jgi:hypothetical protein